MGIHHTNQLLGRLREPDRDVLEKLYIRGLSVEQVAGLLKVSPGNVRIMALRARRRAVTAFAHMEEAVGSFSIIPLTAGVGQRWTSKTARAWAALRQKLSNPLLDSGDLARLCLGASQLIVPVTIAGLVIGSSVATMPESSAAGALHAPQLMASRSVGAWTTGAEPSSSGGSTSLEAPGDGGSRRGGQAAPGALLDGVVNPGNNATQDDASFSSITVSPAYQQRPTLFASGRLVYGCSSTCNTVFRSDDGGGSWSHLAAAGFVGGRILLPPSYPADPVMFAVGPSGLQRSDDGGASFTVVVPGAASAAIVPDSQPGMAAVVIGAQPLLVYHADSGSVTLGPALPPTTSGVGAIKFGTGPRTLIVAGSQAGTPGAPAGATALVRCELDGGCATVASYPTERQLKIVVSSREQDHGTILVYSDSRIHASNDDGQSFATWTGPGEGHLATLAPAADYAVTRVVYAGVVGAASSNSTVIERSTDGGQTFTRLAVSGIGATLQVADLASLPDGALVAALSFADTYGDFGLRCSRDGGSNWGAAC